MPDYGEPSWLSRTWSSVSDVFVRWWREASGPIPWAQHRSAFAALRRRAMLWLPVMVVVVAVIAPLALHFLIGWRARDLASKAVVNAAKGNVQAARLQVWSARNLRGEDRAVARALAVVESAAGNPDAVGMWEDLPEVTALSEEELRARAEAMAQSGNEEQFLRAIAGLEEAGLVADAARFRADRRLSRGDLETAIKEARQAALNGDSQTKLMLLRLLVARHAPFLQATATPSAADLAAGREIAGLVDELIDSPQSQEALVLGFSSQQLDDEQARRWSAAAWRDKNPSNPALLPAATQLVRTGAMTESEMRTQLKALYAGASANHRAALALWFLRRGDLDSALEAVPAKNAAQSTAAFVVRAEVLEKLGKWDELLAMSEAGSSAPSSLRLAARAHASRQLGRAQQSQTALQDALRSSVREGTLLQVIGMSDAMGAPQIVDAALLELCTAPGTADGAFRLSRDRFERSGQSELLVEALRKSSATAAAAPSVVDYRRFELLLSDREVDSQETAAAVAGEPAATERRITHALALLKAGRPQDALAVFDDFNVVVASLSPPQRVVAVAVIAANGHPDVAAELSRSIDRRLLAPGAVALLPGAGKQ